MVEISKEELVQYGCRSCVWKELGQCPYGFKGDEVFDPAVHASSVADRSMLMKGICLEFMEFLFKFADGEDSASALWEKYHVYVSRMQSLEDGKKVRELDREIKELSSVVGADDELKKKLNSLRVERDTLKMWWMRHHELVLKSLGKIVDREQRKDTGDKLAHTLSLQQLNQIMRESLVQDNVKQLEGGDD